MTVVVEKNAKSVFCTRNKFKATLDWQHDGCVDFVYGLGETEEDAVRSLVKEMAGKDDVSPVHQELLDLAVNGWKAQ